VPIPSFTGGLKPPKHTEIIRIWYHYVVGIHLRCQAGQWPMVLNLTAEHHHVLRLLGQPYMALYDVQYS
jgi:hypothetical protein